MTYSCALVRMPVLFYLNVPEPYAWPPRAHGQLSQLPLLLTQVTQARNSQLHNPPRLAFGTAQAWNMVVLAALLARRTAACTSQRHMGHAFASDRTFWAQAMACQHGLKRMAGGDSMQITQKPSSASSWLAWLLGQLCCPPGHPTWASCNSMWADRRAPFASVA